MTPDRWEKIKNLFSSAQDIPDAEREVYLLRACGGDVELKAEVQKLLEASRDEEFMESSAVAEVASAFERSRRDGDESGPRFAAGDLLNDRYEILQLLGRGGMGEVYLAADSRINRNVALKVLHSDLASSAESLRRFALEAQAVSALNHPHIMTIYEFDRTHDGSLFIVAEYVEGQSLNHLIRSGLTIDRALEVGLQVASALSAAHEAGITHRDIKPENLFVRRDGYIKVLDFGLAKLTQRDASAKSHSDPEEKTKALHVTRPGAIMGTAAYMSPEQARGLRIDERTDIWSLGVVLYEMLSGRRPFDGDTSADVMVSVLLQEPPPLSSIVEGLPAELDWIVAKAISKDVDARYQTAKELRADLDKIKKRIEFDESLTRSSPDASIRPDADQTRDNDLAGAATDGSHARATLGEGATSQSSWHSSGLHSIVTHARSHRIGFGLAAALAVVIFSGLTYLGVRALSHTGERAAIDSVAVLPFVNTSDDAQLAVISEGLSEAIIDRLAELPQIRVISRSSSFKFRGGDHDLRAIATQLGVRSVVTGRIEKSGEELIVRVEMTDADNDTQLSGAQYRRRPDQIEALRNDITRKLTADLRLRLSGSQTRRLEEKGSQNSEAFRYYLNGLVAKGGSVESGDRALANFEKAVELDPTFAAAYAEIGWQHWADALRADDPSRSMPKARDAVDKALSIDPELAAAHVVRAVVHEYDFEWQAAEDSYKRAIELSPNLDFARNNYAFYLSIMDRQDEALAQLEEQRVRDPLNPRMYFLQKGIVLIQARRFDDALEAYRQAAGVDPSEEVPDFILGYAYAGKKQYSEAISYYRKSIAKETRGAESYSQPLVYLAIALSNLPDRREESRAILRQIEAMETYRSPALMAAVYASLGDNVKANELLEQAYVKRDVLLRYAGVAYEYDALRNDARFAALLRRMNLKN